MGQLHNNTGHGTVVEEGTSSLLTNGKVRPPVPHKQILTMPAFLRRNRSSSGLSPGSQPPLSLILGQSVPAHPLPQASSGKGRLFVSPHFLPLWEPLLSSGTSASRHLSQGPKVGKRRGWGCREGDCDLGLGLSSQPRGEQ